MKFTLVVSVAACMLLSCGSVFADSNSAPKGLSKIMNRTWEQKEAKPLSHGLTAEEREYIENNFQDYLASKYSGSKASSVAPGSLLAPAEWEAADGVIFGWQGYSSLLTKLIVFVSQDDKAFVVVDRAGEISSVKNRLVNAGAKEENLEFVTHYLNSVWMRDYGPWFSYTADGGINIIDLDYNRPRPSDDKFPSALGQKYGIPAHIIDLILPGGNFILDGHGVGIMTDVTFDPSQGGDPNLSMEQLNKFMADYFGVTKLIILRDMHQDGTGHVDMFCKLLNDTTFIVGQYANASHGASGNAAILDEAAERLSNETNGKGEPFKVFRIPMPPRRNGTTYTYTNSLICNNKVLVPVYGHDSQEAALNVYRKILPNHDVKGFDCNNIIGANGAIHCITKLMMSDPVELSHNTPVTVGRDSITFEVDVESSDIPAAVVLHFRSGDEVEFNEVICDPGSKPGLFEVTVPSFDGAVEYWFDAQLDRGIKAVLPAGADNGTEYYSVN